MSETHLTESNGSAAAYIADLEERLAALEYALDSPEWRRLTYGAEQEFSREGLRAIVELCRVMYLKNPVVQRGVDVKRFYVWGQGWTVQAADEEIQAAIDAFLYDPKNDDVLGSHEARMQLEIELQTDGNLFFAFFVNQATGRVRVRMIPFAEIDEVICNPDDAHQPWFYRRMWTEQRFDVATGATAVMQRTAYYPDWRYTPTAQPENIGGYPVLWDVPVYHVKVGGFSDWRFGVPELYDAIDWARAYKEFLEDWASIVRAYRRFAFQLTVPGGSRTVAAAKTRLGTALGTGQAVDTNPPPIAGSTFVAGEGYKLDAVRTSGATVSAEDGRRILLMVAAAFGLPETFFGDSSVGTLATAKSLDRPTELLMLDRQQLWRDVFLNIIDFVLRWAVKAPGGTLRGLGRVTTTVEEGQADETLEWNAGVEGDVSISFPPLLQHDIPAMTNAIVQAATLGLAGTPAGTIDLPTLSRILLNTLGIADTDAIVERLFPDGEVPEDEIDAPEQPAAEAMMVNAVRELRAALVKLQENHHAGRI